MLPVEPPLPPPPAITVPDERALVTAPVARGDISLDAHTVARYMTARTERHIFEVEGIPVLGIFVAFGDEVSKGDIIAALYIPEIEAELEGLERKRAWLDLELSQLIARQRLIARQAETNGESVDTAAFNIMRNNLRTDLEQIDELIEYVAELNEGRYLRAKMDGVVTDVLSFTEGMRSSLAQVVAIVSDLSLTSFVVEGIWARDMRPGDRFEMTLGGGVYTMEVADPDEFGFYVDNPRPTAYLIFVGAPPAPGFETTGMVHITFREATNALLIPTSALRQTEVRSFVYVLGEYGLREVRDVEPGVASGGFVEIINGLAEGELVVQ